MSKTGREELSSKLSSSSFPQKNYVNSEDCIHRRIGTKTYAAMYPWNNRKSDLPTIDHLDTSAIYSECYETSFQVDQELPKSFPSKETHLLVHTGPMPCLWVKARIFSKLRKRRTFHAINLKAKRAMTFQLLGLQPLNLVQQT